MQINPSDRQFSAEEIDQAGRTLASLYGAERTPELEEAARLVNEWRALHAHPLRVIRNSLKRQAPHDALLAQRLKRLPSITNKLQRLPRLRLSGVQDIGGCRVVVRSPYEAFILAMDFARRRTSHDLIGVNNYIERPRESGYRGLHLVYAYNSPKGRQWQGLRTEIQFRSRPQHQWATAVETVGAFTGQDLKSGSGDPAWLRFFALMSSRIALQEGAPVVPNTPANRNELLDEIRSVDREIGGVHERLTLFQWMTRELAPFMGGKHWVLIELNLETRRLSGQVYGPRYWEEANQAYLERELATQGNPRIDVVLISTNNLSELRRAYPNYFADLGQFKARVRRAIPLAD